MKRAFFFSIAGFLIITASWITQTVDVSAQVLRKGSKGQAVSELQEFLSANSNVYPERIVNGYFGTKTEAAVRRFQKMYGLPQTGIVGSKTRAKMNELKSKKEQTASEWGASQSQNSSSRIYRLANAWSGGKGTCAGTGPKTLTAPPVRLEDILYIEPMGAMSGSHVTPVDHFYFHGKKVEGHRFDVLAPADGFIVEVGIVPGPDDYRIILEHSCTFYSIYIHVTTLSKKLSDALAGANVFTKPKQIRLPVSAGEVIGEKIVKTKVSGQVDYSVANSEVELTGFVVPEHYDGEIWKLHTVDPYQYYPNSMRKELIARTNRTIEPIAGRIDYDIDGRLAGNWFLEGTDGYKGDPKKAEYWSSHMTIAYDYHDPTKVRVSIGDWNSKSTQFAVKHNAPDPKDVSVASGVIAYELLRTQYIRSNGVPWDWSGVAKDITLDLNTDLEGTMLVQLIGPRTVKMETFPGLSASQVNGFTANARTYTR